MRDLRRKVKVYDLKLNRLIKSHLSQNRSKSSSEIDDLVCTRRENLGVCLHIVGADELYQRVLVFLRGKIGVGRYNSIGGRKRPLFDVCRQIYQENFCQGIQSDLRQEMPWGWDPRILVVPLLKLPHSGEMLSRLKIHV